MSEDKLRCHHRGGRRGREHRRLSAGQAGPAGGADRARAVPGQQEPERRGAVRAHARAGDPQLLGRSAGRALHHQPGGHLYDRRGVTSTSISKPRPSASPLQRLHRAARQSSTAGWPRRPKLPGPCWCRASRWIGVLQDGRARGGRGRPGKRKCAPMWSSPRTGPSPS